MNPEICVYAGSFDPITAGHLDIIRRGAAIFPKLVVAVLRNPSKKGAFTMEERLSMLERSCAGIPNVVFDSFDGLLVDYMRKIDAGVILRGLRAVSDFESEFQMAQLNRQMEPQVETFFLMTSPEHAYLSSSAVREIAMFGGDISPFVPAPIVQEVACKLRK
ncbi:MAG: pantetheine-phosphate adenylyltransferase [Clostridiales bacterium]|nr:pantetheine-phosphate adenylyltransferase [Clostridiales bacterium]